MKHIRGIISAATTAAVLATIAAAPGQAVAAPPAPPRVPAPPTVADVPAQKPVASTVEQTGLASTERRGDDVRRYHSKAGFSLVGLKWRDGTPTEAAVRSKRADGSWTGWIDVDPATDSADVGKRAVASEPVWTGPADTVEVRAADPGRVDLVTVRPGTTAIDAKLSAPAGTPGRPTVVTRAQWGADESKMTWPPEYATTTKAVSVHHTAGTNDYTCDQSAAIIRSIYEFHAVTQQWGDIGYSALVDKCGTIFEGRTGGLQYPVLGAHTGGFNRFVFGISMLGTFTSVAPTDAQYTSVEALAAWKLGGSYRDPRGTTELVSAGGGTARWPAGTKVTLPVIFGHRDSGFTECPGDVAYNTGLPRIRTNVATLVTAGTSPIGKRWAELGGDGGFLDGAYEVEAPLGDGRMARFAGGLVMMTDHPGYGTHWFSGNILGRWNIDGGVAKYGYPTADQATLPAVSGAMAMFSQGHRIYYSDTVGAQVLTPRFAQTYDAFGGPGTFGLPLADPKPFTGRTASGEFQDYSNGWSIYSPDGSAGIGVSPKVRALWYRLDGPKGPLGLPTGPQETVYDGLIRQRFEQDTILCRANGECAAGDEASIAIRFTYEDMGRGGDLSGVSRSADGGAYSTFAKWGTTVAITWHPSVGAHWVSGAVWAKWNDNKERFGHVVADQSAIGSVGAAAAFTKGYSVYYSGDTGAHALAGAVRQKYWEMGHTTGVAGYPTSDVTDIPSGGQFADFQSTVSVYASDATGAHWISGALRERFRAEGVAAMGLPTTDQAAVTGAGNESGLVVQFGQKHLILWTPSIGARKVSDPYLPVLRAGGDVATYGFPEYEPLPVGSARFQQFRKATVFERSGSMTTLGWALRDKWWAAGGAGGSLGLPTSDAVQQGGVWQQRFDGGAIRCTDRFTVGTCQVTA